MPAKLKLKFGQNLREDSRLTFLFDSDERHANRTCGFFLCECGNVVVKPIDWVKIGNTKSCGCYKYDSSHRTTHGMSKHPLYQTWTNMMARCFNNQHPLYPYYGGRGVTVCDEWANKNTGPVKFIRDMGERPQGFSLDRVDTNGNYTPENCKWSKGSDQCFNRRKQKNNTSGVPGIYWRREENKWRATIKKEGKVHSLGMYKQFSDAVAARRKAEIEYYGYNNNYWLEKE